MRNSLVSVLVLSAAALTALVSGGCASSGDVRSERDVLSDKINRMAVEMEKKNFSGNVLVMRNDEKVFCRAYGYASVELSVPNNESTVFLLGSCSKQFTAMCVLMLEEEGKLDVNASVLKYFPGLPKDWADVKIDNLIKMTSGIPNFTDLKNFDKKIRMNEKRMCALMKGRKLEFKPGEKFVYSNTNYVLLTYLVEKLSGVSYERFLKERILDKYGLSSTGHYWQDKIVMNKADGYESKKGGGLRRADYIDMSNPVGAGALYSTVGDLAKWDRALRTNPPVSKKYMDKLSESSQASPYTYGWLVNKSALPGHLILAHDGQIDGFCCSFFRFPDDGIVVIVLSNVGDFPAGELASQIARAVFGVDKSDPGKNTR